MILPHEWYLVEISIRYDTIKNKKVKNIKQKRAFKKFENIVKNYYFSFYKKKYEKCVKKFDK